MNDQNTEIAAAALADKPKLITQRFQALQTFTLNRPEVLNAFDDEMCHVLSTMIPQIARNPDIYIVALLSSSPRAFCVGGDVLGLTSMAERDLATAKAYLRREYALDWLQECFSKPTVSFVNGLCMGSGAGLTAFNTHRVAGENYKWAMPETKIGLFPDVGIANVLARLPWPIGLYLGLTGRTIDRADAQWLNIVTHCIPAAQFSGILEKLKDAEPVDPILDGMNETLDKGEIQREQSIIEEHFSGETLAAILRSLSQAEAKGSEWAARTLSGLRSCSPMSLAITDRHIRAARKQDIRQTLIEDYRIAVRCLENLDFAEGVRAMLRDKDQKPRWQHARVEDVTKEAVDAYFAPLGTDELELPSRTEMQAARV